ncbi:MAG: HAMP domain-containing sensor histidine kinase [Bryobacteraceae bacterium]|nr:HAMP domain-containing sensor histidine kinase [Bryobacteraceae bacterium]
MTLRARLLWLSLSTVAIVVVALTAMNVNSLVDVWLDQAIERSDVAAQQMQSFLLKRIEERSAGQPAPTTVAEAKRMWTAIVHDDAELPLILQETLVQSRSIVEIVIAGENGIVLASSNADRISTPMSARKKLRMLRTATAPGRLLAILRAQSDYETRVPIGIPGEKSPVFQIQILVSPALLRAVILPELWRASVFSMLALVVAALLAYVSARIAFRPLERIEYSLDQMIAGESEAPQSWEDREFATVQSKLSLLGAQVSGAKRDASQLRTAISGIARGVAHEFKNPLNAIALRLEVLRARVADGVPEAEGDIDVLAQEVMRLDRVVNTFLDLSRPAVLDRQELQVSGLISQILTLVGPEAAHAGVILEWTPVAGVAVSADGDLLRQAFLNVVRNALDAMPGGGHLRVTVARNGDMCEICVSDTGRGIPIEVRERIFEPYFSTKDGGSGIGLALTMRAMQMHGGSIDVDSAPEQGTKFCLRLPAIPAELPS